MYYRTCQQQQSETRIPIEHARYIMAFRYRMIKIAYLTRFYIVQRITQIGDIKGVTDELAKMVELFGQLGESITGKPVPDEILNLLNQYDLRLQELVDSILSGDQTKADESIRSLYQLADEIATALSLYNPYWDKDVLENFFLEFFTLVVDQVIAVKTGDFSKALDIFEQMVYKAVDIGDVYAEGFLHIAMEPHEEGTISLGELNIIKDMKLVFTQLAYLTRFYMVARLTNLYEPVYIEQRLYALPMNLHEKTAMILGSLNSEGLLNQLSVYTIRLEALINAILSGDAKAIEAGINELYHFSDQVSNYLSAINPYWSEESWKELFYTFNSLLIDEAAALYSEGTGLTEEPQASLPLFEKMLQAALEMGDYFAEGLIQYVTTSENPPPRL